MVYEGERPLYLMFGCTAVGLAAAGIIFQGFIPVLEGFLALQLHPARLLNDYVEAAGAGAAVFNAAVVAAIGLILIRLTHVRLSGPTVAAFFTMMGFGLFGKTPLNILPVILGVFLAAKIVRKSFSEYILIALFGTAIGPVVTFIIAEAGLAGPPAYIAGGGAGIVAGILLPSVAIALLGLHKGYNLYNVGFTAGFLALFAAAFFAASGRGLGLGGVWSSERLLFLVLLIPVLSAVFVISGLFLGGRRIFADLKKILKMHGRLPTDFFDAASPGGGLLNMGIMGTAAWGYVILIGGDFNGPVLGGILTIVGFASFGKHPKNALPVMAGVALSCLVFGKDFAAPGPILAALFATTLAPLSGEFGIPTGVAAGFIHLVIVERTAAWHGGINLYNNGFAGGLTAALLITVTEWYQSNRGRRSGGREK
jgi:hypothetical protein